MNQTFFELKGVPLLVRVRFCARQYKKSHHRATLKMTVATKRLSYKCDSIPPPPNRVCMSPIPQK